MIALVILDQGGLATRDFDIVPEAASRLGMAAADLRVALAPDLHAFMRGELAPEELWSRVGGRTGRWATEDYFETLFHPSLDLPTFDLIGRLVAAGHRVVCGTNNIDSHFGIVGGLGHFAPYAEVYASHLMHLAKPEAEFWEHILRLEGVAAGHAFFADDFPENVEAAGRLGIEARLFTDAAGLEADLAGLGVLAAPGP